MHLQIEIDRNPAICSISIIGVHGPENSGPHPGNKDRLPDQPVPREPPREPGSRGRSQARLLASFPCGCSTMTSPFLDNSSRLETKAKYSIRGSTRAEELALQVKAISLSQPLICNKSQRRIARTSAHFSVTYLCAPQYEQMMVNINHHSLLHRSLLILKWSKMTKTWAPCSLPEQGSKLLCFGLHEWSETLDVQRKKVRQTQKEAHR
jgi:hypothetical protein